MTKCLLLFSLLISTVFFAQQNFKIDGIIINSNQEKVSLPVVVYLLDTENQLVKTTIAQDSKFEFDQLKSGNYKFSCRWMISFKTKNHLIWKKIWR